MRKAAMSDSDLDPNGPNKFEPVHHEPFPDQPIDPDRVEWEHPHRLGRHVEHDARSRDFAFHLTAPSGAVDVLWPTKAPTLNQGQIGACTGNGTAQLINTEAFDGARAKVKGAGVYLTEKDALDLYHFATVYDGIPDNTYPPTDGGSSGNAAAKAGRHLGYFSGYTHTFSFDAFRAAIQTQPVIVGTTWTKKMFTPNAEGVVTVGALTEANIAGGHEYLIRGADDTKKLITCRNSWGDSWGVTASDGVPGTFYITYADFEKLLANQGDVTVPAGVA